METRSARRTVGELMSTDPVVVGIDAALDDATQLMDFYHISGLPVCDWSGFLVGVVTRSDIVRARVLPELWSSFSGLAVRHVMTHPAVTVKRETTLEEAARVLQREKVHRLVVVASDGESPIGVLSASDLLPWIASEAGPERPWFSAPALG